MKRKIGLPPLWRIVIECERCYCLIGVIGADLSLHTQADRLRNLSDPLTQNHVCYTH